MEARGGARADLFLWSNQLYSPYMCVQGDRKLIEVLKDLLLFLYEMGTCTADPPKPCSQGKGAVTSPGKHWPVCGAAQLVKYCVKSSFGLGQMKFVQRFCDSGALWAEILSTKWEGGKKSLNLFNSFLFVHRGR